MGVPRWDAVEPESYRSRVPRNAARGARFGGPTPVARGADRGQLRSRLSGGNARARGGPHRRVIPNHGLARPAHRGLRGKEPTHSYRHPEMVVGIRVALNLWAQSGGLAPTRC